MVQEVDKRLECADILGIGRDSLYRTLVILLGDSSLNLSAQVVKGTDTYRVDLSSAVRPELHLRASVSSYDKLRALMATCFPQTFWICSNDESD